MADSTPTDHRDLLEHLLALSRLGPCTRIRLEQAAGELVFHVGQDDRSVTLAYALKGSVRGKRKVADLPWAGHLPRLSFGPPFFLRSSHLSAPDLL